MSAAHLPRRATRPQHCPACSQERGVAIPAPGTCPHVDDADRVYGALVTSLACPTCHAGPGLACAGPRPGASGAPHRARLERVLRVKAMATKRLLTAAVRAS